MKSVDIIKIPPTTTAEITKLDMVSNKLDENSLISEARLILMHHQKLKLTA